MRKALYDSAQSLSKDCLGSIAFASRAEEKDLQLNLLRELTGRKKVIKKTELNQVNTYKTVLTPASECYRRIMTFAVPQLKIQKIRFKGRPRVDNVSILADSIIAHNLLHSLYAIFKDKSIFTLYEAAEGMPSYISEAFDVSIQDIREKLSDQKNGRNIPLAPLFDTSNGNIQVTTLSEVLEQYE